MTKHDLASIARLLGERRAALKHATAQLNRSWDAVNEAHEVHEGPCMCVPEAPWQDCTPKPIPLCWQDDESTEWCEACTENRRLHEIRAASKRLLNSALRTLDRVYESQLLAILDGEVKT